MKQGVAVVAYVSHTRHPQDHGVYGGGPKMNARELSMQELAKAGLKCLLTILERQVMEEYGLSG